MKRAISLAILASLLLGLFGGYASAQTEEPQLTVSEEADTAGDRVDIRRALRFCRQMFGENDFRPEHKEKCIELWKRWCEAHPNSRICPDRTPRQCRDVAIDRLADPICPKPQPEPLPCRVLDHPTDRRCPQPEPCLDLPTELTTRCLPRPCHAAGDEVVCPVPLPIPVPHPCLHRPGLATDAISIAIDPICYPQVDPLPIDRLRDRPLDRPKDRVADQLMDRAADRTFDRIEGSATIRVIEIDKAGTVGLPVLDAESKEYVSSDAHLGAAFADH